MKPEVVESEKDKLKLKFKPFDQGILNCIKESLWKDKATEMAGFCITHPEVGEAVFTLKTSGKATKDVWNNAIKDVSKQAEEFGKDTGKL